MDAFELYTDGSYKGRWGAWAYLVAKRGDVLWEGSGRVRKTDSNRMEFQAVIEGIRSLPSESVVKIHSDSRVLIDNVPFFSEWASRSWKKKNNVPVPNADLLQQVFELTGQHEVTWKWVKAHSGVALNERCDHLCTAARAGDFAVENDCQ